MRAQTRFQVVRILLPFVVVLGVVAVVLGDWILVAAMAILFVGQVFSLRGIRRQLRDET